MKNTIRISAAILLNANKELLVVRKRGSAYYMLPGGKIEATEELVDALLRELQEELNLSFSSDDFVFLGMHSAEAVNEAATIVEGNIFLLNRRLNLADLACHAEIEEVCWINKDNYKAYQLAHLLEEFALPRWLADFN